MITLGMVCSCTGPQQSSEGENGTVIQAWARYVNAHGGINGYRVRVIVKDDAQNPATGLRAVKELVTQDHVMAIVGETSLVDAAWAPYIASKGVPVVGGASQEISFVTNADFFPSGAQLAELGGIVALAKQAGKTHLGLFYCAESPICAQTVSPTRSVARLLGLSFTSTDVLAAAPSYAAPCLAAKNAGVDVVWVADNAPVVQRFAAACAQQGFAPLEVGELPSVTAAWLTDPNLNHALLSAPNANPFDASLRAVRRFRSALQAYAPGLLSSSSFSYDTIFAWAGGVLFQAAAKAAHLTPASSPADVKRGLYSLSNETLGGLAPPLTFKPGRPPFLRCYFSVQLVDGLLHSLRGGRPTCLTPAQANALAASVGS